MGICLLLRYDLPAIQPSLRDLGHTKLAPALKRRAIFTMSLRDKALAEFPKDIRPPDRLLMCLPPTRAAQSKPDFDNSVKNPHAGQRINDLPTKPC